MAVKVQQSPGDTDTAEALFEAAMAQIKQLEASPLFPNGFESVDMTLDSGKGARITLKLSAAAPGFGAAGIDEDPHIMMDGGVHAEFNAEGHQVIALLAKHDLQQHFPNTWKKVQHV